MKIINHAPTGMAERLLYSYLLPLWSSSLQSPYESNPINAEVADAAHDHVISILLDHYPFLTDVKVTVFDKVTVSVRTIVSKEIQAHLYFFKPVYTFEIHS
jgi:hypothetical protein